MDETKKLAVAYGNFACIVEGFDDPFPVMRDVVDFVDRRRAEGADLAGFEPALSIEGIQAALARVPGTEIRVEAFETGLRIQAADTDTLPDVSALDNTLRDTPDLAAPRFAEDSDPVDGAQDTAPWLSMKPEMDAPAEDGDAAGLDNAVLGDTVLGDTEVETEAAAATDAAQPVEAETEVTEDSGIEATAEHIEAEATAEQNEAEGTAEEGDAPAEEESPEAPAEEESPEAAAEEDSAEAKSDGEPVDATVEVESAEQEKPEEDKVEAAADDQTSDERPEKDEADEQETPPLFPAGRASLAAAIAATTSMRSPFARAETEDADDATASEEFFEDILDSTDDEEESVDEDAPNEEVAAEIDLAEVDLDDIDLDEDEPAPEDRKDKIAAEADTPAKEGGPAPDETDGARDPSPAFASSEDFSTADDFTFASGPAEESAGSSRNTPMPEKPAAARVAPPASALRLGPEQAAEEDDEVPTGPSFIDTVEEAPKAQTPRPFRLHPAAQRLPAEPTADADATEKRALKPLSLSGLMRKPGADDTEGDAVPELGTETPSAAKPRLTLAGGAQETAEPQDSAGGNLLRVVGDATKKDTTKEDGTKTGTKEPAATDASAKRGFRARLRSGSGEREAREPKEDAPLKLGDPAKPVVEPVAQPDPEPAAERPAAVLKEKSKGKDKEADGMHDRLHSSFAEKTEPAPQGADIGIAAGDDGDAMDPKTPKGFARAVGAASLPELMVAAAGYLSLVDGRDRLSRNEIMSTVREISGEQSITAEAKVKAFGKLTRQGDLVRAEAGQFYLSGEKAMDFQDKIAAVAE